MRLLECLELVQTRLAQPVPCDGLGGPMPPKNEEEEEERP